MDNKAVLYRTMVAYLTDLGADLVGHDQAALAHATTASIPEMDRKDLLHYQRVLEATIDMPDERMDKEAMKMELTQVVRERFLRGAVADKISEARDFRARLAGLDKTRYNDNQDDE